MNFVEQSLEFRQDVRRFILGWIHPQTLASERARVEINTELKEHWKPQSIEVYELVLENWESNQASKDEWFVVFIDTDYDVDWIANAKLSPEAKKSISFAESIGARRCKHLPREQVLEFRRLIGQAIVNGIQEENGLSLKMTETAAMFLKDRTVERSRSWTLTFAHLFLLLFSSVLVLLLNTPKMLSCCHTADLLLFGIQGGIIGAYLSIVQRAGRGEWDAAAGRALHFVEVSTKLFAGGILGGAAFVLSQSAFAPSSMKDMTPNGYSVLVFGIAAGLFERLIPKIISNYTKFEKP